MFSGVIPPTGNTTVLGGSTARNAFTTAGVIISAGKIFRPVAPAASAAKASLAVMMPGKQTKPRRTASRTTAGLKLGETMSWPPAACTLRTSPGVSTVPAPIRACGKAVAMAATLSSGCGEFSGISISDQPVDTSACPTGSASAACNPRRMATSGTVRRPSENF